MGYAWNGTCYQTTTAALASFAEDVPSVDSAGINAFTAAPSISGTGLITWSISNRPLTGTTATTRTGTTQLQVCTEGVEQWPLQSLIFPAIIVFAFFLGLKTGFRP